MLFVYPLDYARTRLANDVKWSKESPRQFKGLTDVCRKTVASDGVRGLYRGFMPYLYGTTTYRGLYFGAYESLKPLVLSGEMRENFLAMFTLAYLTTMVGVLAYPFDTIRRRMMMTSGEPVKYKSTLGAARQIVATNGAKSLFAGCGINILRSISSALVLSIYYQLQLVMFGHAFQPVSEAGHQVQCRDVNERVGFIGGYVMGGGGVLLVLLMYNVIFCIKLYFNLFPLE